MLQFHFYICKMEQFVNLFKHLKSDTTYIYSGPGPVRSRYKMSATAWFEQIHKLFHHTNVKMKLQHK